tara:strand:- start:2405 stop:4132 length:1728 start_codon:yes stop_codon:yes gene_type:complete
MAINLNPGADKSIVAAATRSGMTSGPGDYSKQFASVAQSYAETMESNSKLWKQVMDTTLALSKNSIEKAGARNRANIDIRNTPGGEDLENQVKSFKEEIEGTFRLSKEVEGPKPEGGKEGEDGWMLTTDTSDDPKTAEGPVEVKKIKNNPLSRENRDKRADIYKRRDAFYAEVTAMGAGLKVLNTIQASGDFDAKASGAHNIELAEAFAASQTTGERTENGNYFKSSFDPKTKKIIHTLMNDGTGKGGIKKGPVKDAGGDVRTYTTEQIQGILVPKDPGLVSNYTKVFDNSENRGKTTGFKYDEFQSNKDKKLIEPLVEDSAGLHRSIHATFGHLDKSFFEEYTSVSELSAKEYAKLASVFASDDKGNLIKKGALSEVDGMSDGVPGIQQADFASPENQAKISMAMFDKGYKYYDETALKEAFVNWVAGVDGKLSQAQNYGSGYNTRNLRIKEQQVKQQEKDRLAKIETQKIEAKTGLPKSVLDAFPAGTNYGSPEGSDISITGDTFRDLWARFESGSLITNSLSFAYDNERKFWQGSDGKRYGGSEILEMFQPPMGPSVLKSTPFSKFRGTYSE